MADRNIELALLIRAEVDRAIADVQKFRTAVDKNIGATATGADQATAAFNVFKGALGALGVGFSVSAIVSEIRQVHDEMIKNATEAERIEGRLGAVLRATGKDAQFSAEELFKLSDALAQTTRFTDEDMKRVITTLLSFPKISREVFSEAVSLSADLATHLETDVSTAARTLGKALQDPVDGLTALKKAGVNLDEQQQKLIVTMLHAGDTAGAQKIVLGQLRSQIGGSAAGENVGLSKAVDDASKAWKEMLEAFGRTPSVQASAMVTLGAITFALKALEGQAKDSRVELERSLRLRGDFGRRLGPPAGIGSLDRTTLAGHAAAAGIPMVTIAPAMSEEAKKAIEDMERRIALLGKEQVAEQVLFEIQKGKFAHLNQADQAAILAKAKQLDLDLAQQKLLEEDKKIAADLESQYQQHITTLIDTAEKLRDLIDPVREIWREEQKLNEAIKLGIITDDEYARGMMELTLQFDALRDKEKTVTDDMTEFAKQGAHNLQSAFADEFFNILDGNFDNLGASFSKLLKRMTAELLASQLLTFLVGDMGKTGVLGGFFAGLFSGSSGPELLNIEVAHGGGVAGSGRVHRQVPSRLFAGAQRLHGGGVVGLRADEVPMILKRGEAVLTPEQLGRGGFAGDVNVVVQNDGTAQQVKDTQVTWDPEGLVVKIITADLQRGGPIAGGIGRRFAGRR